MRLVRGDVSLSATFIIRITLIASAARQKQYKSDTAVMQYDGREDSPRQ